MQEARLKPALPEGVLRVGRGGSWHDDPQLARVAGSDNDYVPAGRVDYLGFRLVFDSVEVEWKKPD